LSYPESALSVEEQSDKSSTDLSETMLKENQHHSIDEISSSSSCSSLCENEEADLVEAARNGDSLAITLLVVKYRRFLEKYVGLLNIPVGYKEDFIQEGLIGLLKSVHSYDKNFNCSFQTFAQTCVKNAVKTELRKLKRRGTLSEVSIDEIPDGMVDLLSNSVAPSPEDEYIDEESSKQLRNTIFSVLSTYEAEVFEMYLAEIPYSVMSMRIGKDIKSIDNAIQRIKNKLKKLV
jgi:RNA polymerase sporulation-specific sigma factor